MRPGRAHYVVKARIRDSAARTFDLPRQKTMYGGRRIAVGDTVYLFASENEGSTGLFARGTVTAVKAIAKRPGVERQTPRVGIVVARTATARRRLGRAELKPFSDWKDGRPETELNFKFYRQATNKLAGVSSTAAAFLDRHFTRSTVKSRRSRATRPAAAARR